MDRFEIAEFVKRQVLAVEGSVAEGGAPQAAVIGIVANDDLEIFFDTLAGSRKAVNLRRDGRIALAIGWDLGEACTVQMDGVADEPAGAELERWQQIYFARFPDGVARQSWPGICYFRVRPTWVRFSDFRTPEPTIVELAGADFAR